MSRMSFGLDLAELVRRRLQRLAGRGGVVAGADERDDLVDHVEGLDAALEDVLTSLAFSSRNCDRRVMTSIWCLT